jgi:hypothetical protein
LDLLFLTDNSTEIAAAIAIMQSIKYKFLQCFQRKPMCVKRKGSRLPDVNQQDHSVSVKPSVDAQGPSGALQSSSHDGDQSNLDSAAPGNVKEPSGGLKSSANDQTEVDSAAPGNVKEPAGGLRSSVDDQTMLDSATPGHVKDPHGGLISSVADADQTMLDSAAPGYVNEPPGDHPCSDPQGNGVVKQERKLKWCLIHSSPEHMEVFGEDACFGKSGVSSELSNRLYNSKLKPISFWRRSANVQAPRYHRPGYVVHITERPTTIHELLSHIHLMCTWFGGYNAHIRTRDLVMRDCCRYIGLAHGDEVADHFNDLCVFSNTLEEYMLTSVADILVSIRDGVALDAALDCASRDPDFEVESSAGCPAWRGAITDWLLKTERQGPVHFEPSAYAWQCFNLRRLHLRVQFKRSDNIDVGVLSFGKKWPAARTDPIVVAALKWIGASRISMRDFNLHDLNEYGIHFLEWPSLEEAAAKLQDAIATALAAVSSSSHEVSRRS